MLSCMMCMLPNAMRRGMGKVLGEIFWLIVPNKRKTMAIGNIITGLSVDKARAGSIAKQSTTRFGSMILEVLCMPKFNKENITDYVHFEGYEHLTEALSHGKGAIIATSHSGNWEMLGAGLTLSGFPLACVVQKQTNADMDQLINEYRRMSGMQVIYKTDVKGMVKVLGEGRLLAILMDQDAHTDGVMVDFFGRLASTPQGAAALGRLKGTPIIPTFIKANHDGSHTVMLHPPVWAERTNNREQDIVTTTQQLTAIIEQHIRNYPHEWFWLHNRWKHSPPMK
ncbi:MAG: lysophospholipid acyltransferase family protein [Sporomusaceae bacterium]|nr:lysophospholipid acyltransferase family protein [Sporomusaceae bacterium]